MSKLHEALAFASKGAPSVENFRRTFAPEGDALIEGLVSKSYAEIVDDHIDLRLAGVKALLEHEGFDPETGKKVRD